MKLKRWHILFAILTSIAGVLLHFVYEWSGNSPAAALFSAVNESTWEHLKLLVFPYLLFSVAEYCIYGKSFPNFAAAKFLGALAGMFSVTTLFYTYSGILGGFYAPANIAVFFLGTAAAYIVSFLILNKGRFASNRMQAFSLAGIAALILLFFLFSFFPPEIGLFQDPQAGA